MLYKSDIANMALGRLGVSKTITDIENDDSVEAKVIRRHFRTSLNYILEQHDWNFARGVAKLSLQFSNPEPAYNYSYYMPVDALLIRQIAPNGNFITDRELYPDEMIPFQEIYQGTMRLMYTNLDNAQAMYTKIVPENGVFPTHFAKAFAAQLSMDIAPTLITSNYPKISATLNDSALNAVDHGIADDLARQPQYTNSLSTFIRTRY